MAHSSVICLPMHLKPWGGGHFICRPAGDVRTIWVGFSTAKSVEVGIVFHCKICRSGYSLFCRLVFHSKSVEMGIVCNLYTYSSTIVTKLSKIARQGQLYLSKICRYGYKFGKKICMGGWVFSFPVLTPPSLSGTSAPPRGLKL